MKKIVLLFKNAINVLGKFLLACMFLFLFAFFILVKRGKDDLYV